MKFYISIHPPLAGRDLFQPKISSGNVDFNPPAPCGAGLNIAPNFSWQIGFQSTRPLRGGTHADVDRLVDGEFQSTRPLRGGTGLDKAGFMAL